MKKNKLLSSLIFFGALSICFSIIVFSFSSGFPTLAQNNVAQDDNQIVEDDTSLNNTIPEGMQKIAENEFLELFIDKENTVVSLKEKNTGTVWSSNPTNREVDQLASGHARNLLNSQVTISYYTLAGQLLHMNSYFDSVRNNQFEIKPIENGVRVTYRIGVEERIIIVPRAISVDRMQSLILANIPEESHRALLRNFRLTKLSEITDESRRTTLLEQHPSLEETDLYLLAENIASFMKEQMEELVLEAGYTLDDMNEDHRLNNVPVIEQRRDIFTVPLEYTLEGENLVVKIPTEEIVYDPEFPLHSIRLLEFFGAAGTQDVGYILVPDGSGAIINLNNGRTTSQPFAAQVYGRDFSIPMEDLSEINEQAYLPVFGLAKSNRAFLAKIERGAPLAVIRADVSGRINSFNSVFSEFTTIPADVLDVGALSGLNVIHVHQPRIFEGDIQIRYSFLNGSEATYVGMAHHYQNYLVELYGLQRTKTEEVPLYLDVIGAVNLRKPFLGIPLERTISLTSFDQSIEMLTRFKEEEITNINLKFTGWFNGGVNHTLPLRFNHIGAIGGQSGFDRLIRFTEENEINLFPDVAFKFVHRDSFFDGFNPRNSAARLLSRPIARVRDFNVATLDVEGDANTRYVLSPNVFPQLAESIADNFDRLNLDGISIRDVGKVVNADFRQNRLIDRQQSSDYLVKSIETIRLNNMNILVSGGNANILPFVDHVIDIPMQSNRHDIVNYCVPFFQIVLRGYVEYAGRAMNEEANQRIALLRAIELGAGLQFRLIHEENSILKRTEFDKLLSVNVQDWFDVAVQGYRFVDEALEKVQGERIVGHEVLSAGVNKTSFENGYQVVVNYTSEPFTHLGYTVQSEDFLVLSGGELNEND